MTSSLLKILSGAVLTAGLLAAAPQAQSPSPSSPDRDNPAESQRTVSGPDQWDKNKPTGKSYKKNTKKKKIRTTGNDTGQQHRPSNSAVMTKGEEDSAKPKK